MSYDIYFLKRESGQTWDEAMAVMEEEADGPEDLSYPSSWDEVVAGVQEILGEVSVLENPPAWEMDHEPTAIQVSCFSGEWSISVPYWSDGDAAKKTAGHLRAVAEVIQRATTLEAYDPMP